MRKYTDFLDTVERLPNAGTEPIFILDTSAIIDLEEMDPLGLRVFLERAATNRMATNGVRSELRRHHSTIVGRRRLIPEDILARLETVLDGTEPLLQRITAHPMYDHHRYNGCGVAQDICSVKKREHDPLSQPDSHTLALALTLAAHNNELALPNRYPVVLTADEHLYRPLAHLKNPLNPEYHEGYGAIRTLRTRP